MTARGPLPLALDLVPFGLIVVVTALDLAGLTIRPPLHPALQLVTIGAVLVGSWSLVLRWRFVSYLALTAATVPIVILMPPLEPYERSLPAAVIMGLLLLGGLVPPFVLTPTRIRRQRRALDAPAAAGAVGVLRPAAEPRLPMKLWVVVVWLACGVMFLFGLVVSVIVAANSARSGSEIERNGEIETWRIDYGGSIGERGGIQEITVRPTHPLWIFERLEVTGACCDDYIVPGPGSPSPGG